MRPVCALPGLMLAAAPVWAQDGSVKDRFIALVAAQGCVITEDEAEVLLPRHGIRMAETEAFVDAMIAADEAAFDDGTLTLFRSVCTGEGN